LFSAIDRTNGRELWITDGTSGGTRLVRGINPGSDGSDPRLFTPIGDGRAFFTADDGVNGRELWVTDGTREGTWQLADVREGPDSSGPGRFTLLRILAPEAPSIRPVAGDDVIDAATLAAGLTVAGTAEPGVAVTVTFGGATRTATAGEDGAWSVRFGPGALPGDGIAPLEAVATNASGGVSAPATREVTIDSTLGVTRIGIPGPDALEGTDGNARLEGRGGDDTLIGGRGRDLLRGGEGDDMLRGGPGRDTLIGGPGGDSMIGGAGADTFGFRRGHDSASIRDFNPGKGDSLQFGANLLGSAGTGQQAVDSFAVVNALGNTVLDFGGGDRLVLRNFTELAALADSIEIA